jgi:hypothetical protein
MKDKKNVKSFREFNENLNISDVSNSNFSLQQVEMVLDWLREFVKDGGDIHDEKTWNEWKEEAITDLKYN